jgi:nitroreductase
VLLPLVLLLGKGSAAHYRTTMTVDERSPHVLRDILLKRRSIRRFTTTAVPTEVMTRALEDALLAPNSSNAQTWDFYWVRSDDKKQKLVHACLNQSAARTAQELLVVVASPRRWRRSQPALVEWVKASQAPKPVILYYDKLLPSMYRWGLFNSIGYAKALAFWLVGWFRPMMRGPSTLHSIQEVSIKSAALAAENFVVSITAQGFASCMMEGMDEHRVRRLLDLPRSDRVIMVIGVGEEAERGTWGPRQRMPFDQVVHQV